MKKIFSIIFITILAFTLTGCGKEVEITCKKSTETSIITVKNNKIIKQYSEVTQRYANTTMLEAAYQATKTTVDIYNSMKGVQAEVTKNDNSITLKTSFDVLKMDKEDLNDAELDINIKEFIKETEEKGFTCTTK